MITTGHGSFTGTLSNSGRTIDYELSYDELEGIEVRQAHIHAGQMTANGGIVAWLCQTAANPAPPGVNVRTCPTPSGTVTGTITASRRPGGHGAADPGLPRRRGQVRQAGDARCARAWRTRTSTRRRRPAARSAASCCDRQDN